MVVTEPARAESSTTFPVKEAGMAAYVKLDSVTREDLTEAWYFYHSREKNEETYVIGTVEVENKNWKDYPHLYIGLDGWMVAYYLKDEEASQIMQWKDYTPGSLTTTTLKDAIDSMCENIVVTYSGDIKYYDFGFPEANKMTLIAETIPSGSNCFSVTIPGILYEASYSTFAERSQTADICFNWPLILSVDGNIAYQSPNTCDFHWHYEHYDLTLLEVNIPHLICVEKKETGGNEIGAATVLIYQN
jgi:hypothetical protein